MSTITLAELRHVDRHLPDPSAPFAGLVWLADGVVIDSSQRARKREYARQYNALCAQKRAERAALMTKKGGGSDGLVPT